MKDPLKDEALHDQKRLELQAQVDELSSMLDLMAKISALTNRRDVVERLKEMYHMVFGAGRVRYWSSEMNAEYIPEDIKELFASVNPYRMLKEENRFFIKIQWNEKVYGIIEAENFLYPERLDHYVVLSKEIAAICGVVLSNLEQRDQLVKYQRELKYISYHDSLTELFNRRYLNVLLERPTDNNQMAVLEFDIDQMKFINDHFGHTEGDKLIRSTAEVLKNCLRETDVLARAGGDEFVAILPQPDRMTAELVLKRIEEAIEEYNLAQEDPDLQIKISVGFAVTEEDEGSLEELLQIADERLQENKMLKYRVLH